MILGEITVDNEIRHARSHPQFVIHFHAEKVSRFLLVLGCTLDALQYEWIR
jgi:hypothetical protein